MLRPATYLCILLALAACGDNLGPVIPPDAAGPGSPDGAPPGSAPVVSDQQISTAEDTAAPLTIEASDPDGDALQFTLGTPASGAVTGTPPAVTYTPDADFHGTDSFTVEVSDGALTDTATITITVTPVQDAPVAQYQEVGYETDLAVAITLVARDADGDDLTFAIVDQPENGTLSGEGAARTYTPGPGFGGPDGFTFRVSDGTADSNLARVTLTPIPEGCGDGVIDVPEECDDGNTGGGDGCSPGCVVERCGDGRVNENSAEVCDDGNTAAGDGCRADCGGREECGDDLTDSVAGEQCDDGNIGAGDGCDGQCRFEVPFMSVPAQPISGALGCTTAGSHTGRKAAVDQLGGFYVVMNCGHRPYVVTSADRGATWSDPVSMGITGVVEVAIEGGPPGVAYLVAGSNVYLYFTRTTDGGATWQAARTLVTGSDTDQVSMDSFEDSVFVSVGDPGGLHVLRNANRGQGSFAITSFGQPHAFHDVIVDKISAHVVSVSDSLELHLRISSDQGVSFGPDFRPPGGAFFSDWAGSNGFVYVVDTHGDNDMAVIPLASPGTSALVEGWPLSRARAVDADALGNAYVVSQLLDGNVQLDRLRHGATAIDPADARAIGAGAAPAVAALPSNSGALVAYTDGTTVYAAVVVY